MARAFQRGAARIAALVIVVSLVTLVASVIAQRLYEAHRLKPKFAEVVDATARYRQAIDICARFGACAASGSLAGLAEGTLGIPDTMQSTYLERVSVASNGTITATARSLGGLAGETYVLTPHYTRGAPLTWSVSGSCKKPLGGSIC